MAVQADYKNFGIASALVEHAIDLLSKSGVQGFISTAWKHAGKINIKNILERCGFRKRLEIPNYWREDSIEKDYHCPQCRSALPLQLHRIRTYLRAENVSITWL